MTALADTRTALNGEASNTSEMSSLLAASPPFDEGQPGRPPAPGVDRRRGKVADAFNEVVELNERMANELARLSRRVVGKEGD